MKIDHTNVNAPGTGQAEPTRTSGVLRTTSYGRPAEPDAGVHSGDQADLSGLSRTLRALSAGPDRADRVDALAAAYQAGSYQPDPDAVSHRLVEDALNP